MLPTISLNLSSICHSARKLHDPNTESFIGQSYCYHLDPIRKFLAGTNDTLDSLLSKGTMKGIYRYPIRSRVLLWFAATTGMIYIIACENRLRAQFNWLRDIPGYYESAQDYVPVIAKPFMLWDGKNLFRIYEHPFIVEDDAHYISDMGDLAGLKIIGVQQDNWEMFSKYEVGSIFFSQVPSESDQLVDIDDARYLLRHSWYIAA